MAGFGWNRSFGNTNSSNSNRFATTPIACRICDEVFMSVSSLIAHVEAHITSNSKPLQIQGNSSLNPIHTFSPSRSPSPGVICPLSQNISIFSTTMEEPYFHITPQMQRTPMGESASDDSTKPLIQKLQRHYPYKHDLKDMDNDNKNVCDLDLTLKL